MPNILRSRIALLALLGAFLIPIGMSSLRGLTHILTCSEPSRTPFTLIIPQAGAPEAVTSTSFGREEGAICRGLSVDIGTRVAGPNELEMVVPITNNSEFLWRGTVQLDLDDASIPIDIGEIAAGETASDRVTFDLDRGSHDLTGSVLIGP